MIDLLSVWAQADAFLSNGGQYVTISKPTADDIAPYVSYINNYLEATNLAEMGKPYTLALYGLNESIKDKYPDPELIIALDKNNTFCGLLFYYDITIDGVDSYWIETWAQTEDNGSAHLLVFLAGNNAAKNNRTIQWNPLGPAYSNVLPGARYGIDGYKNAETKWHVLTPAQMLAMVDAQKDAVAQTQYFSKVFQDKLSWYLNPNN